MSCQKINLREWVSCCNRLLGGLKRGTITFNRVSSDITYWNEIDLRLIQQDTVGATLTVEGMGVSKFRGQSIPFAIQVNIKGYHVTIKKTHACNTVLYSGKLKTDFTKIISKDQRAFGIIC